MAGSQHDVDVQPRNMVGRHEHRPLGRLALNTHLHADETQKIARPVLNFACLLVCIEFAKLGFQAPVTIRQRADHPKNFQQHAKFHLRSQAW
jgi:hypothetical protein